MTPSKIGVVAAAAVQAQADSGTGGFPPPSPSVPQSSWASVDLYKTFLDEGELPEPSLMERTDGSAIVYPGSIILCPGEPGTGKSRLWGAECVKEIWKGEGVAYIDFEDTARSWVSQLMDAGLNRMQILAQFLYFNPTEKIDDQKRGELLRALDPPPSIVVIDANTEALATQGLDANQGGDFAIFMNTIVRPIREATGATVVLLDHLAKDRESRGRYAIGSGHKLAAVDVAMTLEAIKPFGRGKDGSSRLKLTKDRFGHLHALTNDSSILGVVQYRSEADGKLTITIDPPDDVGESGEFRPTHLMERASRHIEANSGQTKRQARTEIKGNTRATLAAIDCLIAEGFVSSTEDGRSHLLESVKPFREAEDA